MSIVRSMRKYFKEEVSTKLYQALDKAERSRTTLSLGGCPRFSRVMLEWTPFKRFYYKYFGDIDVKEAITRIEKLFPNGIVIVFRNEDAFTENSEAIASELMLRLGGNSLLTSIIWIESKESSSVDVSHLVKKVKQINGLKPLTRITRSPHASRDDTSSNTFWSGHYCIHIKGGGKTICEGDIELGNDIYDFATQETVDIIECQLVSMMLKSTNPELLLKNPDDFQTVKQFYDENTAGFDIKKYGIGNPLDSEGKLHCCLLRNKITSEQFLTNSGDFRIELCHLSAKEYTDIEIVNGKIETCFRPYNLAWGIALNNRMQGTMTIQQFRDYITSRVQLFQ